jgi:guanylate kinase
MVTALIGMTGAGKTSLMEKLIKDGYRNLPIYTTRYRRENEGYLEYEFCQKEFFEEMIKNKFFANYQIYKNNYYGFPNYYLTYGEYNNKVNHVMIVNHEFVKELKLNKRPNFDVVFLDCPEYIARERLVKRGDDEAEINRRLAIESDLFRNFNDYNTKIEIVI